MTPAVDITTLSAAAQRILDARSPPTLKGMAAKGIAPGLKPADAVTLIALFAESDDAALSAAAKATLEKLPAPLLNGALTPELHPGVVDVLAPRYASDVGVMERMLALPQILMSTVADVAIKASEEVSELIATNEERLLKNPVIIEKLYMNKATRMSTADRMIELAVRNKIELTGIPAFKEAAQAIANELIAEASREASPSDVAFVETLALAEKLTVDPAVEDTHEVDPETGEEVLKKRLDPLKKRIEDMTISEKIRTAMIGNTTQRMMLIRDANKLVAQAAVRSPALQENEVVRITASRNVPEDALRVIAMDKEWTRAHQIKLNLVYNPRCPFAFASKLIPHLREGELKALAKSKNVTGAVAQAAKQQLLRKGIKT